jgi:sterol 3beta-glucosyltransferase
MRFVIVTLGSEGDVRPYMALAHELEREDHVVSLATSENFSELIHGAGLDYLPMKIYYGDRPSLFNWRVLMAVNASIENKEGYLAELWAVCQNADAIIYNVSTYPCFYIAEKLGIPSFGVFVQPHHASKAFPHPIVTDGKPMGGMFNRASFWLFNTLHWRYVRKSINQWRRDTLKLPPIPLGDNLQRQLKKNQPRILYAFSPAFLSRPADWHFDNVDITGYWFLDTEKNYTPPKDLEDFLNNGTPPVFINVMWNRDKFDTPTIMEISHLLNTRLIIQDLYGQLDDLASTENIFYIRGSIPHEWLFKRISVAIHHGGLGISMNCIRAALPMIAIPAIGVNDQRFWAHRIEKSGVGIHFVVSNKNKRFAKQLVSAIKKAMHSDHIRARVTEMSIKVKAENGLQNTLEIISSSLTHDYKIEDIPRKTLTGLCT